MDCPNRSPSPSSACAAAVSVVLSLTGSTFSATDTMVSNSVLNSVVTRDTSITSLLEIRCGVGFFGARNATYLLPKTVVALMSASTLAGIRWMYFGSTSSDSLALVMPPSSTVATLATRPISTPL
jgi:hypothetical protein